MNMARKWSRCFMTGCALSRAGVFGSTRWPTPPSARPKSMPIFYSATSSTDRASSRLRPVSARLYCWSSRVAWAPYGHPQELMYLWSPNPNFKGVPDEMGPTVADFYGWQQQSHSFSTMALLSQRRCDLAFCQPLILLFRQRRHRQPPLLHQR